MKMSKRNMTSIFAPVAAALLLVFSLTAFCACGDNDDRISQAAESFINHVMRIKTPITLDSAAEIEAGYVIYDFMNDKDKSDATVKENKVKLDGYKADYDILRAEQDILDAAAEQERLIERFEFAVNKLPALNKLTSENRADIEEAFALYEKLNEQSRAKVSVRRAYETLGNAESRVAAIEREEHLAEVKAIADAFIEGVEEIGEVTLDSKNAIEDLLFDYDNFTDEIKEYKGVADAKQTLDEAYNEYMILKDDADIESLKDYAQNFSPVDEKITLDSERDIINAEKVYQYMSDTAKSAEGVAEAYAVIVAARARFDALFEIAEAERVQKFIAAVKALPTDIENVDITWFDALEAARTAYTDLKYDTQNLPEVEEWFKIWNAAQQAFDKKGYKRLPMTREPNITFSGDVPAHLVLGGQYDNQAVTKPLYDFYGVNSKAELDAKANLMLNVYVNGIYQGKVAIKFTDIGDNPGHLIYGAVVVDALKRLAAETGNPNIVSGASYAFALSYEDKDGTEIIPSPQSKVSAEKVYSW